MKNNRIYIAGKITGDEDYKLKFKDAKATLETAQRVCDERSKCESCPFYDRNYIYRCRIYDIFPDRIEVVSPVEFPIERMGYWRQIAYCLRFFAHGETVREAVESARRMRRCKYVYFLPDWQESRGAKIEHRFAKLLKKRIVYGR